MTKMQKGIMHLIPVFIIAIFVAVAILLVSTGIHIKTKVISAEEFTIQQLTSSFSSKAITDMDGNKFVWEDNNLGNGRQIVLYDGSSVRQLTNDEYPLRNVDSKIDGDYVVWVKEDGSAGTTYTPQVYAYKISTGQLIQVTNDNQYRKHGTDVANGKIVWWSREGNLPSEIAMYDLTNNQLEFITSDSIEDMTPVISKSFIGWMKGEPKEIYNKNLTSGEISRLTFNDTLQKAYLQINGDKLVWGGHDGTDVDIYLYDGNQVIQITNNNSNETQFSISGDKLAYEFNDGITDRIAIYTISSQITEIIGNGNRPKIDDQRVVWLKYDSSQEVYTKNLLTGEVTQVTTDTFVYETNIFVSGGLIAWVGQPRPLGWPNVFVASLSPEDTPIGSNVVVTENMVTLTYSQVTSSGETTITTSSSGTQPPTGFKLGNPATYYSISTTATFTGNVEVCINYDETTIQGSESKLKLMHFVDGQGWVNTTTSLDTTNNIICGITTNFSEFTIMTEPETQGLVDKVEELNLQQGIQNSLDAKLQRALNAESAEANNNNNTKIINALGAFINEVEAQKGNKLTNDQADELHSFADNLIKIIQGIKQF